VRFELIDKIVALTMERAMPAVSNNRAFAVAGGLMSRSVAHRLGNNVSIYGSYACYGSEKGTRAA
jgi:hypothetical protein